MAYNCVRVFVVNCTGSYYDSLMGKTYCYFYPTTTLVSKGTAKTNCASNGGAIVHVNSAATYAYITTQFPAPPM